MKKYKVEVTPEADAQLRERLLYLLFAKNNEQAYEAVKADYYETLNRLSEMAGMIREPDEPELREWNLKRIQFQRHKYVILFTIKGDTAIVSKVFHMSEDYLNKI